MDKRGTLYLIPTTLGGDDAIAVLAGSTLRVLQRLTSFIVENPKTARKFLKAAGYPHPLQSIELRTLDEHTPDAQLPALLAPLLAGRDCGLLSEAGCPAVADPGAALVRLAHAHGIRVVPLVGPSAVLLALMASGMNGQRFAFRGYLPVDKAQRREKLLELERDAQRADSTQIFIEAPYRNQSSLQAVLETCRGDTLLCLATELTLSTESIHTQTIAAWKRKPPDINRRPTVFLLYRNVN
ncbi:MAG: SAM-dependent methyltransferase [Betaproteobacteria bacterium RIFCSPLOWO2_12_FULL_62_58]|nr:MAG: SAM-dependent methyltransferase [Betaproteobacteria bacterium RIFCSPLOWO2_02_FULL_62_79]OGA51822.1 MAG: SAM-dependent methyltransferase [Betaproteobacteria bacterium RIFCSPLOWO2_12_FULL_62_58]